MERRTFLATASLSPLFAPLAAAQGDSTSSKTAEIDIAGNKIFVRRFGTRPRGSHGSRVSADQPDVAIPCAEARRHSHGGLRRPAGLRAQRDTPFCGRPFSVFQARHGEGTG